MAENGERWNVNETNIALCTALGLDPSAVKSVSIFMHGGEPPVVQVQFAAHYMAKHPELNIALKQFTLTPLELVPGEVGTP